MLKCRPMVDAVSLARNLSNIFIISSRDINVFFDTVAICMFAQFTPDKTKPGKRKFKNIAGRLDYSSKF